jgi:hypothetical protein
MNNFNGSKIDISVLQPWLKILLLCWLLASVGLGWLIKSALILIAIATLVPVAIAVGLFWWLRANFVISNCPVCEYQPLQGINGNVLTCPSCGEKLTIEKGQFLRATPPGTIDVVAVEVDSN